MEFLLRPWKIDDIENLARHANNPKIPKWLMDGFPNPYTKEDAEAFIKKQLEANPIQGMAIEVKGEAVGAIGIHPQKNIFRKNAEMGYWLAEPFWGHGIMTGAIREMVSYAFKTFDVTRIFARPFGTNIGSKRALEKAGFILEARYDKTIYKNGEYLDELIYAVRKK